MLPETIGSTKTSRSILLKLSLMSVIVPINRKKFPLTLIVSLIFTIAAIINLVNYKSNETENYWAFYSLVLLVPLYYFVVSLAQYIKTLFDKRAGLTISDSGLNDNLSILSFGEIPWRDITGVQIKRYFFVNFLVLYLADNKKYLVKSNYVQKFILKSHIRKMGSPVVISEKRIAYDIHELKKVLLSHLR